MIRSVVKTYVGKKPHEDGLLYWTYLLCKVHSGVKRSGYSLVRVCNSMDRFEVLARECPRSQCLDILQKEESPYLVEIR